MEDLHVPQGGSWRMQAMNEAAMAASAGTD